MNANLQRKPVLVLLAGVLILTGCGKTHQAGRMTQDGLPAVAVRTETVDRKKWPSTEEVVGTVRAKLRATIEAKVSGRIAEMPIVLGQKVRAGELLVRLNAPEIKARLEQAEASLW